MKQSISTMCLASLFLLLLAHIPLCVKGEELPSPNDNGVIAVTVTATGQFATLYSAATVPTKTDANDTEVFWLKVSGPLSGPDISIVKWLVYTSQSKIRKLDLSDAQLKGEGKYYEGTSANDYYSHDMEANVVGKKMFCDMSNMTDIILPSSVTTIGESAFESCYYLNSVDATSTALTTIEKRAFYNCTKLTTATLNTTGVTTIGDQAFYYCQKLANFQMPTTVRSLGEETFYWCEALTSVTLPEGITVLPKNLFYYCNTLTTVNIPTSVTVIDDGVFYDSNVSSFDASSPNLTRIGKEAFYYCRSMTSITLPSSATSHLTVIDDGAFKTCDNLTSIDIPSTVTTIGKEAFSGCSQLASVTMPTSLTTLSNSAFSGCGLTSITLPEGLTAIPNNLFRGCSKLATVNLPSTLESIGEYAFYHCYDLTTITLPQGLKTIDENAFSDCSKQACNIVIPTSVETIASRAFYECRATLSLAQPASVQVIGKETFESAGYLSEAVLPNLTSIGEEAFKGCSRLTKAVLPNSMTALPNGVLEGCEKLTDFTLPTSLTSIGNYPLYNCKLLPAIVIPSTVTAIGDRAFYGCETITSIEIPEGVTKIEYGTFWGCKALTSVSLPSTLTSIDHDAFRDCEKLPAITLPNGVQTIDKYVFYGCKKLEELVFPASVETIGEWAFYNCDALERVTLPTNLAVVQNSLFRECPSLKHVTLPAGASISNAEYLFYNCTKLETITLPTTGVTTIPNQFCYGCESLQSFTIPAGVTTIGDYAFYQCKSLPSVTIPGSVTSIGESAFDQCSSLQGIVLPEGVQTLGSKVFQSCTSLASATLPATTLTAIPSYAFNGCSALLSIDIPASVGSIGQYAFNACSLLANVTFHEGLTTIGSYAFRQCGALQQATIPNTVTSIGSYAFSHCSALQSIVLPVNESFTEVPNYLCQYCTSLTSVTLPENITKIGSSAFYHCENLASINLHDNIAEIGSSALAYTAITDLRIPPLVTVVHHIAEGCNGLTIVTVPEGVVEMDGGFDHCENLRLLYLPSTLTKISSYIIESCPSITEVHIKSPNCKTTSNLSYLGRSYTTLFVPKGSLSNYTDTQGNWSFATGWKAIVEEDYSFTGLPDAEWQVLKQLPQQTGGAQWARQWTLGETAATSTVPQGVTMSDGHIVGITLPLNNLQGELPSQLFTLPNLETLDLSGNQLTGQLSTVFNSVPTQENMKELNLAGNQLTGNVYHISEKLPNLTLLNVANNHIRDVYPMLPSKIEHLNIGGQDLTDVVTGFTFNHLRQLKENPGIEVLPTILFYYHSTTESSRYYYEYIGFRLADNLTNPEWHAYVSTNRNKQNNITTDYYGAGTTYWYQHPTGQTIYAWGGNTFSYFSGIDNKQSCFAMTFDFEPGDVNFDLEVNVSDMQQLLRFAQDYTYYSSNLFNFTAGNLKADDDIINVQDVVLHINLLLDKAIVPTWSSRQAENTGSAETPVQATLTVEDGRLVLRSEVPVAAIDVALSDGDAQWQSSMDLFSRKSRGGRTIFYSLFGDQLPAGETVMALTQGDIVDAMIVDLDGHEIPLAFGSAATGIGDATRLNDKGEMRNEKCYDLQGRRVDSSKLNVQSSMLRKGIYVKNGKKQVVK